MQRLVGTKTGTDGRDNSTGNESSNISRSRVHCSCGWMSVPLTLGIITLGIDLVIFFFFFFLQTGAVLVWQTAAAAEAAAVVVWVRGSAAFLGIRCRQGVHHKDSRQKRDRIQACHGSQEAWCADTQGDPLGMPSSISEKVEGGSSSS